MLFLYHLSQNEKYRFDFSELVGKKRTLIFVKTIQRKLQLEEIKKKRRKKRKKKSLTKQNFQKFQGNRFARGRTVETRPDIYICTFPTFEIFNNYFRLMSERKGEERKDL